MRRSIFLSAVVFALLWSPFVLATTATTGNSGDNDKPAQRKEAMAVNTKPKPKAGAAKSNTPIGVAPTPIRGNSFKIAENEGPRPQDRVYLHYDYFNTSHVLFGAQVSGDFQQTTFSVDPAFTVNGNGVMGGIFAAILMPVPNTNIFFGPRVGWQGGNVSGSVTAPPASPFTYFVRTDSMFYQEAMIRFAGFTPTGQGTQYRGYDPRVPSFGFPFITASLGVAEVHTTTRGTLGMFSVTDGGYNPGITLTTGIGMPITRELMGFERTFLGGGATAEVFLQWRGTMTTAAVNLPGSVPQAFWIEGVEFGFQFRY